MPTCPRCRAPLRPQNMGAIALDGCDSCGGLWFDADELAQLAGGGSGAVERAEAAFEPPAVASASTGDMQCPKCAVLLYSFRFKHTPEVTLDACPQCRGLWADDHELAAIAERMGRGRPAAEGAQARRQAVRHAVAFVNRVACPECGEANPSSALVCWACGSPLRAKSGMLLCPRCDHRLCPKVADTSGLALDDDPRLDHCEDCGGIWISQGQLSLVIAFPEGWLDRWARMLAASVRGAHVLHEHCILCPACHVVLAERTYGAGDDAYVDQCDAGCGLWLDNGELTVIKHVSVRDDPWRDAL